MYWERDAHRDPESENENSEIEGRSKEIEIECSLIGGDRCLSIRSSMQKMAHKNVHGQKLGKQATTLKFEQKTTRDLIWFLSLSLSIP